MSRRRIALLLCALAPAALGAVLQGAIRARFPGGGTAALFVGYFVSFALLAWWERARVVGDQSSLERNWDGRSSGRRSRFGAWSSALALSVLLLAAGTAIVDLRTMGSWEGAVLGIVGTMGAACYLWLRR